MATKIIEAPPRRIPRFRVRCRCQAVLEYDEVDVVPELQSGQAPTNWVLQCPCCPRRIRLNDQPTPFWRHAAQDGQRRLDRENKDHHRGVAPMRGVSHG